MARSIISTYPLHIGWIAEQCEYKETMQCVCVGGWLRSRYCPECIVTIYVAYVHVFLLSVRFSHSLSSCAQARVFFEFRLKL